ncbi:hypothetical protein BDN70DRAFT_937089 [Pholiota conissans]|uniref:Uncharacterized protein n=1 Tax=Pholiota conissans TaxID=109636 RepID=A0A9P6CPF1_9AGAR|nr:hypothetical protein BDN70DRAFT_937089 [Pholiota conissans]
MSSECLPKHVKFWYSLGDKLVDLVYEEANFLNIDNFLDDGMTEPVEGDGAILNLKRYPETSRRSLETFYPPDDAVAINNYVKDLISWTQENRKDLLRINAEMRNLKEETVRRQAKTDTLSSVELQVRTLHSTFRNLWTTSPKTAPPMGKTLEIENTEPDTSTADINSILERISYRMTSLAAAHGSNNTTLHQLQTQVSEEENTSQVPEMVLTLRPVIITPDEIKRVTTSMVASAQKSMIKDGLEYILEGIKENSRIPAEMAHKKLEIPSRTIVVHMKKMKINQQMISEIFGN